MPALRNFRALPWLIAWLALVTVELDPWQLATIQWIVGGESAAEWYEIRYRWLDVDPQTYTVASKITDLSAIAVRPRSGHWAVEVRSCQTGEEGNECSEWTKSDVKGSPEPWIIFWKPPKPSNIIIEDEGS